MPAQPRNSVRPRPTRHQAADRAHDGEEQLAADPRRAGHATEQHGEDRGDRRPGRSARSAAAARAAARRLGAARRPSGSLGSVIRAALAGRASIRSPAIGAATSAPRPACSTRTAIATFGCLGRREADEPRVRLARAAELGRPRLAGGRDARDLGAGRELRGRASPSTACDHRRVDRLARPPPSMTRPIVSGPIARVPPLPRHRVTRRGCISSPSLAIGRRDEGHLERRDERLGLAVRGVRQLDVVDEAARRAARRRWSPARPPSAGRTGSAPRSPSRPA